MTQDVYHPQNSVLEDVQPARWSDEKSVRYEVAIEALGQLTAACSARIAHERNEEHPRQQVIDECRRRSAELSARRRELDSDDDAAIESVFADFPVLLGAIHEL